MPFTVQYLSISKMKTLIVVVVLILRRHICILVTKNHPRKEGVMDNLILIVGWGSPIGVGVFLLCIAGMVFILSKAHKKEKRD